MNTLEALRVDMLKEIKPAYEVVAVKEKTIADWANEFDYYYFEGAGELKGLKDCFNEFFKNTKITPND